MSFLWLKQSIPEFVYCSVRAGPWLLHDGQQRGHQQLQGHPPGDGQVAWLMIMRMTIVTMTMIVALKKIAALTDDLGDDYCHSGNDCRSEKGCQTDYHDGECWHSDDWLIGHSDKEKHSGEH